MAPGDRLWRRLPGRPELPGHWDPARAPRAGERLLGAGLSGVLLATAAFTVANVWLAVRTVRLVAEQAHHVERVRLAREADEVVVVLCDQTGRPVWRHPARVEHLRELGRLDVGGGMLVDVDVDVAGVTGFHASELYGSVDGRAVRPLRVGLELRQYA